VIVGAEAAVVVPPAKQALWVGSSYWGTRNRHPPRGPTWLATMVNRLPLHCDSLWLGPNSGYPSGGTTI